MGEERETVVKPTQLPETQRETRVGIGGDWTHSSRSLSSRASSPVFTLCPSGLRELLPVPLARASPLTKGWVGRGLGER